MKCSKAAVMLLFVVAVGEFAFAGNPPGPNPPELPNESRSGNKLHDHCPGAELAGTVEVARKVAALSFPAIFSTVANPTLCVVLLELNVMFGV